MNTNIHFLFQKIHDQVMEKKVLHICWTYFHCLSGWRVTGVKRVFCFADSGDNSGSKGLTWKFLLLLCLPSPLHLNSSYGIWKKILILWISSEQILRSFLINSSSQALKLFQVYFKAKLKLNYNSFSISNKMIGENKSLF